MVTITVTTTSAGGVLSVSPPPHGIGLSSRHKIDAAPLDLLFWSGHSICRGAIGGAAIPADHAMCHDREHDVTHWHVMLDSRDIPAA